MAPYNITVSVTQLDTYGEEYDDWNSAVFRSRRNCSSDGTERTVVITIKILYFHVVFKILSDSFCMFQDVKYPYTVDLTGTRDRSEYDIESY